VRRAPHIRLETPAVASVRVSSSSHLPTPGAEGISPTFPPLSSTSSTSASSRSRGSYYRQDYETGLPLGRQQQESVDVSMFDPDPYPPSPGPAPRPMVLSNSVPPQDSRTSEGSNGMLTGDSKLFMCLRLLTSAFSRCEDTPHKCENSHDTRSRYSEWDG
jgi:hypothetical protein